MSPNLGIPKDLNVFKCTLLHKTRGGDHTWISKIQWGYTMQSLVAKMIGHCCLLNHRKLLKMISLCLHYWWKWSDKILSGDFLVKMTNHSQQVYQVLSLKDDQIKVLKIEKYSFIFADFWHKWGIRKKCQSAGILELRRARERLCLGWRGRKLYI